jgi:hypothetical protein
LNDWIIEGKFPKRVLKLVIKWAELHKSELLEIWNLSENREPLRKIEPLK